MKFHRRLGTACAVALVLTAGSVAPAHAQGDHAATQALLDQYLMQAGPGAAVYAGDSTEAWTLTAGTAEFGTHRPITTADHYRIGSQTKTFTAAVVLQLFDEGRVELDAPIERYLPGVVTGNYDGHVITVRQLLQHTSGLVRDVRDPRAEPDGTFTLAALVASAMDEPPQAAPGATIAYSNVAYLVLGMLIERVTGQSAGEAITNRVITPLGLEGTSFPAPRTRGLPDPYLPGYGGGRIGGFYFWYEMTTSAELSLWSTAGNMASTLDDLVEFFQALGGGRLFSATALAEMRRVVAVGGAGAGLGIDRVPLPCGGEAWAKNGGLSTGHTSTTLVTDDGRFASIVTNTLAGSAAAIQLGMDVVKSAVCEGVS
ncbi:serine hydrolase domain-containing protein [Actinokineospora pegani]|uniref:serine hydrolase domain-containing protein n=1 Tax=Actinokineospora pegani TaxID=2654637 RepID=UPI0012EA92A3|nr:serine hydrolase domain-containing protein [Actinokineospora pegani]